MFLHNMVTEMLINAAIIATKPLDEHQAPTAVWKKTFH